jgi:hypothetical protein
MGSHLPVLLSTAYLPPVQYISKFIADVPVLIEKHENYQKQSYRNRCYIYGANGRQCLVIPVKNKHWEKTSVDDVEIDYQVNWQKVHMKSIESAYRLSAFYEYYADEFRAEYEQRTALLFDWNLRLLGTILHILGIKGKPELTKIWEKEIVAGTDHRQDINPKSRLSLPDPEFNPLPYQQVFQERYGFIPNLSIVDLIFNEGPMALSILQQSVTGRV